MRLWNADRRLCWQNVDTGTDRNNEILDRLNKIRQEKEELEDILSGLREGIAEKNRQAGESRNREKELWSAY